MAIPFGVRILRGSEWNHHIIVSEFCLSKNLGRLWLAYTELQGDFTCYNVLRSAVGMTHIFGKGTLLSHISV